MQEADNPYENLLSGMTGKGQKRVADIMQTAVSIVSESGWHALTLRDVARKTGMRLGNLQHYFSSIEALVEATLHHTLATYLTEVQRRNESFPEDPQARFGAHLRFLLNDITQPDTNAFFFSLWDFANRNDAANRAMDEIYSIHRQTIEEDLRQIRPNYPEDDIPIVAAIIVAQIEGLMVFLSANRPKHPELDRLAESSLKLLQMIGRSGV